jgi:hypothetical protein
MIPRLSGRDAAFFFSGLFSAVLLSALACLALYAKRWWQIRRQYSRQMEHELDDMDGIGSSGVRGVEDGEAEAGERRGPGFNGAFSMSRFRSDPKPVREASEDEP